MRANPELRLWRPLYTGVGGGHDINLRQFATSGMTLLGRLTGVTGTKLYFATDLMENLAKSGIWFDSFKLKIDSYAREHGLDLKPDDSPGLPPEQTSGKMNQVSELDLSSSNITAVLWAGGFKYDFSWIKLPHADHLGEPQVRRGVSNWPGLYFLGLRRTYTAGSSLLAGVGDDADYIAHHLAARS